MPAIQVSLFCLAIGQDPKSLPVAVVNAENQGKLAIIHNILYRTTSVSAHAYY